MAPFAIRFIAVGFLAAVLTVPFAGEANAAGAASQVAAPGPVLPMPDQNVTHEQFLSWVRISDLGKLLRRDEGAYTIERTRTTTVLRVDQGFQHVLLAKTAPDRQPVVGCVATVDEAEAFITGRTAEAKKP